jgi:hypothetical protein
MDNLIGVLVVCEVMCCSDSTLFILSRPCTASVTEIFSHMKPASTGKGSLAEGHDKTDTCSYGVPAAKDMQLTG